MSEAVVGFVVFSLVLLLYLPAYRLELERVERIANQTNQWRVFYEVCRVQLVNGESDNLSPQTNAILSLHQELNSLDIASFETNSNGCHIRFTNGDEYHVATLEAE